jgi:hypothetical protein
VFVQRGKTGAEKHAAQQKAEKERKEERLRPLRKVAKCIKSRGYQMTRPQFGFQTNTRVLLPWVEAMESGGKDVLHFPLMLFYPEKLPYHDTVEDACELDTISGHLDMVRQRPLFHGYMMLFIDPDLSFFFSFFLFFNSQRELNHRGKPRAYLARSEQRKAMYKSVRFTTYLYICAVSMITIPSNCSLACVSQRL